MSQKILIKRSAVSGKIPATTDIDLGELAVNTADGRIFMKRNDGGTESIIDVSLRGIDDTHHTSTNIYSAAKVQDLHDLQTQAIANLATAQGSLKNSTTPIIADIPLTNTVLPFDVMSQSSDMSIFEFDDANNLVTFKKPTNYNFNSVLTFLSNTNSPVDVTFELIDVATSAIVASTTETLSVRRGSTLSIPVNTLVNVTSAPLQIRIEYRASASGYTFVGFNSVLASGSGATFAGNAVVEHFEHVATEGQVSFSAFYSSDNLEVYRNGLKLSSGHYTATDGVSVVLTSPASLGDLIQIMTYNTSYAFSSAGDVLNLVKQVDGAGSGLDADLLDGLQASDLYASSRITQTEGIAVAEQTSITVPTYDAVNSKLAVYVDGIRLKGSDITKTDSTTVSIPPMTAGDEYLVEIFR